MEDTTRYGDKDGVCFCSIDVVGIDGGWIDMVWHGDMIEMDVIDVEDIVCAHTCILGKTGGGVWEF